MPITGYYDGSVVQIQEPLKLNQRVIVIPIDDDVVTGSFAAGGLKKYAIPSMVNLEKDAWKQAAVKKYEQY